MVLPGYLCRLAGLPATIGWVQVRGPAPTVGEVLDALEARWPMLRGTLRTPGAPRVKAHLRVFAGSRDVTREGLQAELPQEVLDGRAALRVVAAVSGG